MSGGKLKIRAATAQEVCAQFALSDAGRQCLKPEMPPLEFLSALAARSSYADAFQFLARALPKREAVWWSCCCTRELPPDPAKPEFEAGLQAAEAWVRRPSEENRRSAEKAGQAIKAPHPARWAAMGAFWSGGSLAPPGAPEAKPPEDLTAKAVAGAVLVAAALDPAKSQARNKLFFDYGLDIANGGSGRNSAKA
jgi:hypothetical protein